MNQALYLSFVITSIIVLALPGPSLAYAVAVGIRAARREILLNAIGMGLGGLVITVALAFGVAQLVAMSALAFTLLKAVGCAYLVFLGIRTFFASPVLEASAAVAQRTSARSALLQGFLVETANPKAILFYVSLVPQFVDHTLGNVSVQLAVLGVTFVTLQVAWDIALMLGVVRLRSTLAAALSARAQRLANRLSGSLFVALGVALLLQERPRTKF